VLGFCSQDIEETYAIEVNTKPGSLKETDFVQKLHEKRSASQADCKIVQVSPGKPSTPIASSSSSSALLSSDVEMSPRSILEEYGAMFSSQSFESSDTEKLNKVRRIQALIAAMPAAQKNEALSQLSQIQANRAQTVQAKRVHHSDSATSISSQQASPKPTATTKTQPSKKKLKNADNKARRSRSSNSDDAVMLATNPPAHTSTSSTCLHSASSTPTAASMPCTSQAATEAPTDTSPHLRFIIIDGSNVARE